MLMMKVDGLQQQVLKKPQKARGAIALKPEHRAYQTREYFGQSGPDANGTYSTPTIQRSEKPQFKPLNLGVAKVPMGGMLKTKI